MHRGELLGKIITKKGLVKSKVAAEAGFDRTTYYYHIKQANLDYTILEKYGRVIGYDFTTDLPEMQSFIHRAGPEITTLEEMEKDRNKWKEKYYELLEEYHELKKQAEQRGKSN
ncbi:hypothetical protein BDE36_2068 [Arcticibacter tournemirensis]|nr:hypothetical protein BDE36_2068 [Arcticibacter tournemirensis]